MVASQGEFGVLEPVGGGDPIPLLKDRLVIGRRKSCDICLRFSNISTAHCELILEAGYWKVRDLQSTNGIKVNGERVLEKRVYPGDELTISKHRYRLDYTPTTSRSADAEVDELHEDIMRFSLLERAGLTKSGDKAKVAARRPVKAKTDEDAATDLLHIPVAKEDEHGKEGEDRSKPSKSSVSLSEEAVEAVSPAASSDDLTDEEFLKIVEEDEKRKAREREKKKPS